MSFPLGLFYVYIIDIGSPPSGNRSLVAFMSRASADEYWRTVQEEKHHAAQNQTSEKSQALNWNLKRLNPQCFNSPLPWGVTSKKWSEVTITQYLISGGLVAPSASSHGPDNINGGSFYIRSVIRPNLFWAYNVVTRRIEISSKQQTKFVVRRTVPLPFECLPEEDILIGSDDVTISFFHDDQLEPERENFVVKGDHNGLVPASGVVPPGHETHTQAGLFKFNFFDGAFRCKNISEGFQVFVAARANGGDRWEFVN